MSAISWTKAFVSRALVCLDRSWESLVRRQGWWEMCTLAGRGEDMVLGVRLGGKGWVLEEVEIFWVVER